ncbi:MAG: Uma2 family endonuclease [Deltaproteobacteria bacterium]|nr:Uma2 family endonuclease [Deltaproteobacteria bacterium]
MVSALRLRNYYIYDDLETFPDDGKRREIIAGDLYVNPSPLPRHQRVSREFLVELALFLRHAGLGEVLDAPIDVRLGDDVFGPDIVVVLKAGQAVIRDKWIEGPPDIVIEILSPSTEKVDRTTKANAYARHGVPEYWLVDAEGRRLERYELRDRAFERVAIHADADVVTTPRLPGFRLELGRVWA